MSSTESKTRKENDHDNEEGPVKKKAKQTSSESPTKQSNLLQFFGKPKKDSSAKPEAAKFKEDAETKAEEIPTATAKKEEPKDAKPKEEDVPMTDAKAKKDTSNDKKEEEAVPDPIIPHQAIEHPKARWKVVENCMLVRRVKGEDPRSKVAAFDVDGTLLVWRIAGWPSKFEHYELWSADVVPKLQDLHDRQGYKLVLFSNQGAIRSAFAGKKATFVKSLLEWLAHKIDRPVSIVMSTNKKLGFHKPNPGMWKICETNCNGGTKFDVQQSFFVGDSVGDEDPQGGVDEKFAKNIGDLQGETLKFYTPEDYFGPSDSAKRQRMGAMSNCQGPPKEALEARKALLGGYLKGPIVLLLSGVQGSGKSTFCKQLFIQQDEFGDVSNSDSEDEQKGHAWVHVAQDTINKGKPGKREGVEKATREALSRGQSVVVDRTHLEPAQREHFVLIAKELKVPAHVLVLQTSKEVISKRVKERTNHPGGVEGEKGVRVALMHMSKMSLPTYKDEGFDLISCVQSEDGVKRMSTLYRRVVHSHRSVSTTVSLPSSVKLSCGTSMPMTLLGTMKVGRRVGEEVVKSALKMGWKGIDTAPTYKNEDIVGKGLDDDAFVIAKVPKRVTQPEQVRQELAESLDKLGVQKVGLLLLHWPCDVIEAGTLLKVWEAMEKCVAAGKCQALGVANCSIGALKQLLPHCKIPPAVNQVERHPLLPQTELVDFCNNQGIVLQAHTPLGQGKLLTNETIVAVAKKARLTPAQAVLMWNLQHGVSVVPKAATEEHQEEIVALGGKKVGFLSPQQMKALDGITEKQRYVDPPFMNLPTKVYAWNN